MTLDDYIKALGLTADWFQFDGGRSLTIKGRGLPVWRGSYEWGEESRFDHLVRMHLDAVPWPTEDDPRVQHEGAYL